MLALSKTGWLTCALLKRGLNNAQKLKTCAASFHKNAKHFSLAAAQEATLPSPSVEGESKTYPPKIVKMVDDISHLSLIEVSELNELLKIKLNISDIPMMSAAAPVAADSSEEEAVAVKEQTEFAVKLMEFKSDAKVKVIKVIKSIIPDCNLVKAKGFVESLPQIVRTDMPKEEAEELIKTLTEAGGTAVME